MHKAEKHKNLKLRALSIARDFNPVMRDVPVMHSVFPAGESCITLDNSTPEGITNNLCTCDITLKFKANSDLFDLALLADAVRRIAPRACISLFMPYLPYARQDRVCNSGEPLSVKVVADFINSLAFTNVVCHDLHSDVSGALINNLTNVSMSELATKMKDYCPPSTTTVMSPDAGAMKKVLAFANKHGYDDVLCAEKVRDTKTGAIKCTKLPVFDPSMLEKDVLIMDDICDGGATFISLAKLLREQYEFKGKIYLYVTHGIFSANLKVFNGHIDAIFTSNLMRDWRELEDVDLPPTSNVKIISI